MLQWGISSIYISVAPVLCSVPCIWWVRSFCGGRCFSFLSVVQKMSVTATERLNFTQKRNKLLDNQKINRESTLQIRFSFSLVQSSILYQNPSFQINFFCLLKKESNFGTLNNETFKTKEKIGKEETIKHIYSQQLHHISYFMFLLHGECNPRKQIENHLIRLLCSSQESGIIEERLIS